MGKKHQARKAASKKLQAKAGHRSSAVAASKKSQRGGAGIHKRGPPPKGASGALALVGKGKKKKKRAKKEMLRQGSGGKTAQLDMGDSSDDDDASERKQRPQQKNRKENSLRECYTAQKRTLLIGEGNFSFARGLVENLGGQGGRVTATAYDSQEEAVEKYSDVLEITAGLIEKGVEVRWSVDACDLKKGLGVSKNKLGKAAIESGSWRYNLVAFHFPHAGKGIKDQEHNIRANQQLLAAFFGSAVQVLTPDGEVHVTVKTGKPYDQWQICSLAHRATAGRLQLKSSYSFNAADFPGYTHRRTIGFKEGLSAAENEEIMDHKPRTYVWRVAP